MRIEMCSSIRKMPGRHKKKKIGGRQMMNKKKTGQMNFKADNYICGQEGHIM